VYAQGGGQVNLRDTATCFRDRRRRVAPNDGECRVVIEASAPVRICDNGGWTDTWFGGPGRVLNIAVTPRVEVSIRTTVGPDPVVLDVDTFGDRYSIVPRAPRGARHPLLEAAIDAFPPPGGLAVEVTVRSGVPAGCGTGTSATVAVALLGGLTALRLEQRSPRDIAYAAHRLEVDNLGVQSGIQDHLSAAFGGINYLEIEAYPQAKVSALPTWEELSPRLTLVFLGRAHDSSAVHRQVIEAVGTRGSGVFSRLRGAAVAARDAVLARDLDAFGHAMIANTEAQGSLHPGLVGVDARRVIECAAAQGATGWKVNGAGGDGGSVTILSTSRKTKEALEGRVTVLDKRYRVIPIQISPIGLEVRGAL
jgi:D-glycero-alpha-D-manno-heptose-7-phosphate kinase